MAPRLLNKGVAIVLDVAYVRQCQVLPFVAACGDFRLV